MLDKLVLQYAGLNALAAFVFFLSAALMPYGLTSIVLGILAALSAFVALLAHYLRRASKA